MDCTEHRCLPMERTPGLQVTLPNAADEEMIRNVLKENE